MTQKAQAVLARKGTPGSLREYVTTSGVVLKLANDIYVTAPAFEDFCAASPHVLDVEGESFFIRTVDSFRIDVQLVPLPFYHDKSNKRGIPYISIGVTHTDRVRVSPVRGCSFSCQFCDIPYTLSYATRAVDDIVDMINVAKEDQFLPARHALISGGTPLPRDMSYMEDVLRRVPSEVSLPVDVMMVPRTDLAFIDRLYTWGIDTVYFNVELYNEAIARTIMPQKHRITLDFFLAAIERAVGVFGKGKVQSLLIVGLEPTTDTLRCVEKLADVGCIPVLSPFRPSTQTPLRSKRPPSSQELVDVYVQTRNITERHGLRPGPRCVACHHNTLSLPDESEFYIRP
jgi:hypothetical protein